MKGYHKRMGSATRNGALTLRGSLFQGILVTVHPDTPSLGYNPMPETDTGFKLELFPLHSPLLGESLLVSFPPLNYMLKFSG
jgi:hypothetical protein